MSLRDRIEDFIYNVDEIQIAILLVSLIIGTATAIGVSSNKSELKNTNFEIKEAPVLAKFSEQNIGGNSHSISTNYDYRFILDIDEDGLYNKNKDIVIAGDNIPYYLLEKDNRIVYLEVTRKDNVLRRSPLVVKDKEEKSHLVSEVEDCCNVKFWKKNESFNKTNQIFKDKYINQR
ncbi:MAG: hypothetical protein J6J27_01800 [Alphaproteobacteria bacterium]|nr:hypothetical protein [Alphaproteobacteria bacterium]